MDTSNTSFNLATLALLVIGLFVVVSVFTLLRYFLGFGGRGSPLEFNAYARIEAAQKPEDLLRAQRAYRKERFLTFLVVVLVVWGGLRGVARAEMDTAQEALYDAVALTVQAAQDSTVSVLEALGVGSNCCDCATGACVRK